MRINEKINKNKWQPILIKIHAGFKSTNEILFPHIFHPSTKQRSVPTGRRCLSDALRWPCINLLLISGTRQAEGIKSQSDARCPRFRRGNRTMVLINVRFESLSYGRLRFLWSEAGKMSTLI